MNIYNLFRELEAAAFDVGGFLVLRHYQEVPMMKAKRNNFTLIELLIVVGVIAVLLAMQMGSFNRAKQAAKFVRWYSFNKQYSYDPSCVVNFNFQDAKTVTALANSAAACRVEGFNAAKYVGTLYGDFEWCEGRFGVKKRALRFNGVNTFIELAGTKAIDFTSEDDFTIVMWVKFDEFSRWDGLFSKSSWGANGGDAQYDLYYNGTYSDAEKAPGTFEADAFMESYSCDSQTVGGKDVALDNTQWVNIAMRYRSIPGEEVGNVDIFVNGEQMTPDSSNGGGNGNTYRNRNGNRTCDANLLIGAIRWQASASETGRTSGSGYKYGHNQIKNNFSGLMDEFMLFNRALGDRELKNFYLEGKP